MSEFGPELVDLICRITGDYTGHRDGTLPQEWNTVCELGLAAVGISESCGGSGGTVGDLSIVIRELAKAGIGTPIVEASTAAWALGEVPRAGSDFDTVATAVGHIEFDGDCLSGALPSVRYAQSAKRIVLLLPESDSVVVVETGASAITMTHGYDLAGHQTSRVEFDRTPARLVASGRHCEHVRARLGLARATALVGSGTGAYLLTRGHVAQREQFGVPLIKIPAVAAGLARISISLREAETATFRALALQLDDEQSEGDQFAAAAVARVMTAEMATFVARQAHQLHGAIGVTEEYPLHWHTRNLWAWRDADESALEYSKLLGDLTVRGGELALWDRVSV